MCSLIRAVRFIFLDEAQMCTFDKLLRRVSDVCDGAETYYKLTLHFHGKITSWFIFLPQQTDVPDDVVEI